MTPRIFAGAFVVFCCALEAAGQTLTLSDPSLQAQNVITTGLSQPIGMRFLGPNTNDFFVIEKASGQVKHFVDGVAQTVALDLPVASESERGLLGIALQPNFDPTGADTNNNKVYLYYSRSSTGADATSGNWLDNRLVQVSWNGATLTSETTIATLGSSTGQGGQATGPNHDGGPITFGPDGKLYGIVGDLNRSRSEQNQGLQTSLSTSFVGGIYRLNPNGTVPSDNPFTTTQSDTAFHRWYAYGVRNSFGLTFDPANGSLWDTENGPSTYDEINLVAPGFNSGWSDIMGPDANDPQGVADLINLGSGSTYSDPEFSWFDTNAPTSIQFLYGSKLGATFDNKVFVADINTGQIYLFTLNAARNGFDFSAFTSLQDLVADDNSQRDLLRVGTGFGGVTDFQLGPDGFVYAVSIGSNAIYRIAPGDFDDDRDVDAVDVDLLWRRVRGGPDDPGANDSEDLNGDGFVNEGDVDYLLANLMNPDRGLLGTQYGDANLSGGVPEFTDFNLWRTGTGGWAQGDFDGSGGVPELTDFNLWRTGPTQFPGSVGSHGDGEGVGLVPEPATIVLMGLALPALAAAVRRRK